MGTALWLTWEAARALGLPLLAGYLLGRWTQRRDTAHDANHENPARTTELERDKQ